MKELKKSSFFIFCLLAFNLSTLPVLAQDNNELTNNQDELSKMSEMSLEEILNLDIVTTTKTAIKAQDAPGIVTAYSNKVIEELGYYTLSDLANITPGYSSYTKYGEKVFETRGQKADSFNNNKHLLLVDGIPVNHARAYKAPIEEELPLFFAKRVEFLKGPGSALYGTSAFFGVVNVIPKELKENGFLSETKVSFGTLDFNKRIMSNTLFKNDLGEGKINLGYYKKDAFRAFVGTTESNANLFWDDQNSKFINISYKFTDTLLNGLSSGIIYMSKNGGLGEHWMESAFTHQVNDLTWETFIPYVKYQRVFDNLNVNSYLKLNESMEKGFWVPFTNESFKNYNGTDTIFAAYDARVENIEGLAEASYDFSDRINFILGLNFDTRYQKGVPDSYEINLMPDKDPPYVQEEGVIKGSSRFNTYSAYTQLTYRAPVLKDLLITLGGRQDIGHSIGLNASTPYFQFSPRIGIVQKVTDNFNVKLLWGNALRAPGLKESGLNELARTVHGDEIKPLKAETISTLEVGANFNTENLNSSVNYFYNRTTNALDGTRYKNDNIFVNSTGLITASGVEGEVQYVLNNNFHAFANYAFAMAKNVDDKFLNDVPVQNANLGLNYTFNVPFNLSSNAVLRWVSDYHVTDEKLKNPAGFFVTDLNFVSKLTDEFTAELLIGNIFDYKYKLPKNGLADIPMPRRSFTLSLGYNF